MTNIDSMRAVINRHFQHVTDLGDGVIRGERVHNDKPFAVAYIDLSDSVVERSQELKTFQEKLLGPDFFSPASDLRWNSYLYFLAGPKSTASSKFGQAKSLIEGDRHFARKFVVNEEDLARRLGEGPEEASQGIARSADAGAVWSEFLRAASLSVLIEQRPRTTALELIANGEAFKAELTQSLPTIAAQKDTLANGFLRKITIGVFRRVINGKSFEFGDVNLIVGSNGTGKTSLLEAIEVLYCGRVRRDPSARFQQIVCEVEDEHGVRKTISATTNIATLKARNIVWYGRTDLQASAITQGFTRFNFLDTDAAFRLSSQDSNEQIKDDLARLLVGPETSKLWTYLSKLAEDINGRLKGLDERLPSERKNVELLSDEVRRLREAPSEANALLKAFRSSVIQLNPTWEEADPGAILAPIERTRIEDLSRALSQIIAVFTETPVSQSTIERRITRLKEVANSAKSIRLDHDAAVKRATDAANAANETRSQQAQLEKWAGLVEAGIPTLATKLRESEARVSELRSVLREQPADSEPDVAADFAQTPIEVALEMIQQKHLEAQEQEKAAASALSQGIQLGQTLAMLRRDLHDASIAYLERSGETTFCPVCKVAHPPKELIAKIQDLVGSEGEDISASLRGNVQNAKERLEQVRTSLAGIRSLDTYWRTARRPAASTVQQLQEDLRQAREDLRKSMTDVQTLQAGLTQLSLAGHNWQTWRQMRDAVTASLSPAGADPMDLTIVRQALEKIQERLKVIGDKESKARDAAAENLRRAADLASTEIAAPTTGLTPAQAVASIERLLQQAESAAETLAVVRGSLSLGEGMSLEALQSTLEACLLAFDKAMHALQKDEQSRNALNRKDEELQTATATLSKDSKARANFARAAEALSSLVKDHSLEKATGDAFSAIKGKVSNVFAQIHSPPEYELGDFSEDQLIIRRDNKQPHAVNQVSSGQRAGLALSIFLALNESAKSAPPIVLIDDPVAHIDDMNALSFLDYLRDMAVGSRKQIFFATADVRLAALFQRKFEFLGDTRFKRIALAQAPSES